MVDPAERESDDVPASVESLVNAWLDRGRPTQNSIPWPRDRWIAAFPEFSEMLAILPDRLDRQVIRTAVAGAGDESRSPCLSFVAAMAWGYGRVGYGPFRVRRALSSVADPEDRLGMVARTVRAEGGPAAYEVMAGPARLAGLGPAFGTKFMYFCPQMPYGPPAIILDRLVADWLNSNAGTAFNPVPWRPVAYAHYIRLLVGWGSKLGVEADDIEECIFVASAAAKPGQWSENAA